MLGILIMKKYLPLGILISLSCSAHSAVRQYSADLDSSMWKASNTARLECQLEHNIPRYGKALFVSRASKSLNLNFALDMFKLPDNYSFAKVESVAPSFKPGVAAKQISQMQLLKQFDGELEKKAAWTMISELEKGFNPTFYYQDWYSDFDKISVSINSANFHKAYDEFLVCLDNLLPYSFDDISFTVLTYQSNTAQLSKSSQKRLNMIAEYLKQDPSLELVLVDAFTDSYGGRWHNQELSKKRAQTIKTFFTEAGVDAARVETQGFGEKRHIASNSNVIERAKNRRVVIRMDKND